MARLARGCSLDRGKHRYTSLHAALALRLLKLDAALPANIDNQHNAPPVFDQGPVGSCEGHASSGASALSCAAVGQPLGFIPSMVGIYNPALALDRGDPNAGALQDLGTETNTVLRVLHEFGLRPMGAQVEGRFSDCTMANALLEPVLADLEKDALTVMIGAYQITQTGSSKLAAVKAVLAAGLAVRVDSFVDMAFENWSAGDAPFGQPDLNDPEGGGHALYLVGYQGDNCIMRNSWSSSWGDNGNIIVSPAFVEQADCFAWTVKVTP